LTFAYTVTLGTTVNNLALSQKKNILRLNNIYLDDSPKTGGACPMFFAWGIQRSIHAYIWKTKKKKAVEKKKLKVLN